MGLPGLEARLNLFCNSDSISLSIIACPLTVTATSSLLAGRVLVAVGLVELDFRVNAAGLVELDFWANADDVRSKAVANNVAIFV